MITRTLFSHMSDDELLNHAYQVQDPLTVTELETELLSRFELSVETFGPLHDAMSTWNLDVDDVLSLICTLEDFNHNDVLEVRKALELADKFADIASTLGDDFNKLNTLINENQ